MKSLTMQLWAAPEKLDFSNASDEQFSAFLQALGRQVFYGLRFAPDHEGTVARGGIQVGAALTDIEICLTYESTHKDPALEYESDGRPFTCAGISRDDGTRYSYHS